MIRYQAFLIIRYDISLPVRYKQAKSNDTDFKVFYLQNIQHLEQREKEDMSDEEIAAFHEKQRTHFANVKSRFPELWELSEENFTRNRNKAWDIVKEEYM